MDSGNLIRISKESGNKDVFKRAHIDANSGYDEKWLQERIFEDISLLSVTDADYDRLRIIPLCREFSLHDGIRNVFLDILAVTETGRLILVECKLWKNPQARREVLAQVIEYASLLQTLSYSDFVSRLKKYIKCGTEDPLAHRFREMGIECQESLLIDRVSRSLEQGKFQLIIAGDGIRADMVNLVNSPSISGVVSDICLLEIGLFENSSGDICLLPSVPVRTRTVEKTVLVSPEGTPVKIEEDLEDDATDNSVPSPVNHRHKESNREFWNTFIKQMHFDHPDQEIPRIGGNNWIKIPCPKPFSWFTAYRTTGSPKRIGIFVKYAGPEQQSLYDFFSKNTDLLKEEVHADIQVAITDGKKIKWENGFSVWLRKELDWSDDATTEEQMAWFSEYLNRFVNSMRPLLRTYNEKSD